MQIHVDSAKNPELTLDEKLTFNSTTNLMGPRKFLHHGLLRKAKSSKELVAFLFNDFLLLTYPSRSVAPQFHFERHHDIKLRPYKTPIFLDEIDVLELDGSKRKSSIQMPDVNVESKEFGIEFLIDNQEHGSKMMAFEAQNIHDRKLWLQNLKEAIVKYKEKAEQNKTKKNSGK